MKLMLRTVCVLLCGLFVSQAGSSELLKNEKFGVSDAVLVVDQSGQILFDWQSSKPLVPASLTKLVTSYLAINKWGLEHRFTTDFYLIEKQLWIKGYGDPFIVSEEFDIIVERLNELGVNNISSIHTDSSHFNIDSVPGRSKVADPYNAPPAAVSANFNTAMLQRRKGKIVSAEPQTPLTPTAASLAHTVRSNIERVNLVDADRAQRNFAELLQLKAGWAGVSIHINQTVPAGKTPVYRHRNSKTLADVLRGTLEFSNNFIANQVFLKLAEGPDTKSLTFGSAGKFSHSLLSQQFDWQQFKLVDGSGLSRKNRFSAAQLATILKALRLNKSLLKQYKVNGSDAAVHAKTGTLSDVQSYAGYIEFPNRHYRFVFIFNRPTPYRYREQLLERLVLQLAPG